MLLPPGNLLSEYVPLDQHEKNRDGIDEDTRQAMTSINHHCAYEACEIGWLAEGRRHCRQYCGERLHLHSSC